MASRPAALIVAAGQATRLREATAGLPKCLVPVGGETILSRTLDAVREHDVNRTVVVVGHEAEQVRTEVPQGVELVLNPFYSDTNNMASLWFGLRALGELPIIYLHGDVVFAPALLARLLEQSSDTGIDLVVDTERALDDEAMKVRIENGRLIESGKEIPLEDSAGEWIGLAHISPRAVPALARRCEDRLGEGRLQDYDTAAFTDLAHDGMCIGIIDVGGLPWIEIDTPDELKLARRMFPG